MTYRAKLMQMLEDADPNQFKGIPCWVADTSEEDAISDKDIAVIDDYHLSPDVFIDTKGYTWVYAVPLDIKPVKL